MALVFALIMTKAKVSESVEDGARLFDSMGPVAILPQLLVALGALFTTAGVGEVISQGITGIVPADNRLLGVVAYVLGMVIFTMIMGNAFAAFSVITAGIGIPFVLAQGANPVIAGALALTAGYCGTLLTPMAANFNIVPAALLERKMRTKVIKVQAPISLTLSFYTYSWCVSSHFKGDYSNAKILLTGFDPFGVKHSIRLKKL